MILFINKVLTKKFVDHSIISEFTCEFPQISHTVSHEITTGWAGVSQVLCKLGSENAHRCAQNAENGFGFDFFKRYHKDAD
jgi:hypothetical protein